MSVIYERGLPIGTKSKTVFVAMGESVSEMVASPGKFTKVIAPDGESQMNVALWGADNMHPQNLTKDIDATGVLAAGIDIKARILMGRSTTPAKITGRDENGYELLEWIDEPEVQEFLDFNSAFLQSFGLVKDLFGYGNAFVQILLSRDRKKIVAFKHVDANMCRFSAMNPNTGKSDFVYVSSDWSTYANPDGDPQYIQSVPLLDKDFPLVDLQERTSGYVFMVAIQYPLTARSYYATSPWQAARKWSKIAQGIPEMKDAMFKNQITLKYIVEIHPQFWEEFDPMYKSSKPDEKKKIQDAFYGKVDELLVGGTNAYKSLFSTTVIDRATGTVIPGLKVTAIDDKIKDGKLLIDSSAANGEILFALGVTPCLMGADMPGGPYTGGGSGGSNIREAFLVQIMLGEYERQQCNRIYKLIGAYNGWPEELVIRYPNQLLTTLNQGGNTKTTA